MSSILTNTSAYSALKALRSVTRSLSDVQNSISTGMRVSEASDNVAYWSIATTMRSDNRAIATVIDALGLGAAKVDVSYQATEAVVGVLSDFKAKLLLARGEGNDRTKIQQELTTLADHAQAVVASASFAGTNWLETTEARHLRDVGTLEAEIVASFSRESSGVSIGTIGIDLKAASMINAGGGGILQKGTALGTIGGFRDTGLNSIAHNGHEDRRFTGPATFADGDFITFELNVDGGTHSPGEDYSITIDKHLIDTALGTTDGTIGTALEMRAVLERAFVQQGIPATTNSFWAGSDPQLYEIGSTEALAGHPGSSIAISNVTSSFAGGFALGLENGPAVHDHDNMYPQARVHFDAPFTVAQGAGFTFDVRIGSGPMHSAKVDRATVDAALGTNNGSIESATDMAAVLQYASRDLGLAVTAALGSMVFSADQTVYPEAGNAAPKVYVGNVRDTSGYQAPFDLAEIDLLDDRWTVDECVRGVDHMLSKAIDSAATLGAAKRRIDMQSAFLTSLSDTVRKGIGQLVDTDMDKSSVRIAALQTQHQLASQSLQIANRAPEMILRLFQT